MIECARCGAPATEYDPHGMAYYCHECAVEIAKDRLTDEELLDAARFESMEGYHG